MLTTILDNRGGGRGRAGRRIGGDLTVFLRSKFEGRQGFPVATERIAERELVPCARIGRRRARVDSREATAEKNGPTILLFSREIPNCTRHCAHVAKVAKLMGQKSTEGASRRQASTAASFIFLDSCQFSRREVRRAHKRVGRHDVPAGLTPDGVHVDLRATVSSSEISHTEKVSGAVNARVRQGLQGG